MLTLDQLKTFAIDSVRTVMMQTLEAQRDLLRGEIRATCKVEVIEAHRLLSAGRLAEGRERLTMIKALVARMETV